MKVIGALLLIIEAVFVSKLIESIVYTYRGRKQDWLIVLTTVMSLLLLACIVFEFIL